MPDPDPDSRDTGEPPPIVEVRGLSVRRSGRSILGPLDWTVRSGERWVVLGPNGSGKTTLLSTVLVSHHLEEIPPGFRHALVLAGGIAVAAGPIETVLSDDVLTRAYGMPITVEWRDGRAWARKTRHGR